MIMNTIVKILIAICATIVLILNVAILVSEFRDIIHIFPVVAVIEALLLLVFLIAAIRKSVNGALKLKVFIVLWYGGIAAAVLLELFASDRVSDYIPLWSAHRLWFWFYSIQFLIFSVPAIWILLGFENFGVTTPAKRIALRACAMALLLLHLSLFTVDMCDMYTSQIFSLSAVASIITVLFLSARMFIGKPLINTRALTYGRVLSLLWLAGSIFGFFWSQAKGLSGIWIFLCIWLANVVMASLIAAGYLVLTPWRNRTLRNLL